MYRPACQRIVGTKKKIVGPLILWLFAICLALFLPVLGWIIGLGIFIIALIWLIFSKRVCAICGTSNLLDKEPVKQEQQNSK